MNELRPTGWHQFRTLLLTADSPAVPITIPLIANYDTFCLVISPAADVYIVTEAGQIISAMTTLSDGTQIYGIFCADVLLYAYSSAPESITVTPFADLYGEMTELPVTLPAAAADYVPWTVYEMAEMTFQVDHDTDFGSYRAQNVLGSGSWNFTFHTPSDFDSLDSITVGYFGSAGAAGPNKDIDLESMYCGFGEVYNINNQVDTTSVYTLVGNGILGGIDVTNMFSSLGPNHCCGLEIDFNGIGGALKYLGIIVRYLRVHS